MTTPQFNPAQQVQNAAMRVDAESASTIASVRNQADLGVSYSIIGNDFVAQINDSPTGRTSFVLSTDPMSEDQTSYINLGLPVSAPFLVGAEFAMAQRSIGDYFCLEAASNLTTAPTSAAQAISSIQQSTTTLTIVVVTPFAGDVDDWVNIYGVIDNRLNYCNAVVATVSTNKLTITVTIANDAALPSLSVGPYTNQGNIVVVNHFMGATDGVGYRFNGTTNTQAGLLTRYNGASAHDLGATGGSALSSVGSTAIAYPGNATGQSAFKPSNKFAITFDEDSVCFSDKIIDSSAGLYAPRGIDTGVKPNYSLPYQVRLRSQSPKSNPRPIARIVTAVKTGTTTATITTDVAHNLVTGNYVTLVGIYDTTNFPNLATATTVTVIDNFNFTIIIGGAVSATSHGGAVCLSQGGSTQPALIAQVIQSATVDSSNNVTLIGSATWSNGAGVMNVGDFVNLYGCMNASTGVDMLLDGIYVVNTIVTTTLILSPLKNYPLTILGGNGTSPVSGVVTTTNCGGIIIVRDTACIEDIAIKQLSLVDIRVDGQGTSRIDKSLPINIVGGSVNQGARTTTGSGWYVEPDNSINADIASAAIATTATTSAITPTPVGAAAEFNIIVTSVSGTTPTMDIIVQESDDSGTNWYDVYHFPRITATGAYRSPLIALSGNRLRYVQTIAGTTPSFTRSLNRITHMMVSPAPYRQIYDRALIATQTLNATTASLITNGTRDLQLIMSVGTITTTAPTIQLQGSDDNGASWYNIGAALAGGVTSNATVTITNVDVNAGLVRAIVTIAGVATTLNYILLKCFG